MELILSVFPCDELTTEKLLIASRKSDLYRPLTAPLNVRIIGSTLRLRVAAPRSDTPTTEARLP